MSGKKKIEGRNLKTHKIDRRLALKLGLHGAREEKKRALSP